MNPGMDSKRRVLDGLASKAKEWRADAMRRKYMPQQDEPMEDPSEEAMESPDEEATEDAAAPMGETPESVLATIDPEQLKQLLAALAAK